MKVYFHKETGAVYQLTADGVWGHPVYENNQLLDLDVEKAPEWTLIEYTGETFTDEGKELSEFEFIALITARLTSNE